MAPPPWTEALAVPQDFGVRVVAWQRRHGRHHLPWQGTRDAYRIWLSEIMLQQTQVTTVMGYYPRFLERFPTVADLAAADQGEVLAVWSGLGYYSRARNLHRCAQAVMAEHAGHFPTDAAVLVTLPGIGRSTAAAIAAFSVGQRVAILDANVKRVLCRHRAVDDPPGSAASERRLWALAEALVPPQDAGAYTQGLMDLGSLVCTPRKPQCLLCPVSADCVARQAGTPERYPLRKARAARSTRHSAFLLCLRQPRAGCLEVALVQRPQTGIWAGLWSLPMPEDGAPLWEVLQALSGTRTRLPEMWHALTHLDWCLQGERIDCEGLPDVAAVRWVAVTEALRWGLPVPIRRVLESLTAAAPGDRE